MSDPMTNLQIEDVLSSIRRLVAEGDKTRAHDDAAQDVESAHPKPAKSPDRLVLTPALRVEGDVPKPKQLPIGATDNEAEIPSGTDARNSASVSGAETLRAAGLSNANDATSLAAHAVTAMFLKNSLRVATEDSQIEVQPVSGVVPDLEPDMDEVADVGVYFTQRRERDNDADKPNETTLDKPDTDEPAFRHFDRQALIREEKPLYAHETQEGVDDVYGDDLVADETPDPQIDAKLNAFLSDDAMLADAGLDEDTLRALIVDVIRQELQGVMGERITRNVRKLVRREINRVLAAQDFD